MQQLAWQYRDVLAHSVLIHFVTAVTLGARGKLKSRHVRFVHTSAFVHVVLIVILAKAMFYITW